MIIKEINFSQRKVIGLKTDGKLIKANLNKTLLKLVFSKDNIILKKDITKVKVKDEEKLFDAIVEELKLIPQVKEEISKKKNKIKYDDVYFYLKELKEQEAERIKQIEWGKNRTRGR